MKILLIQPAKPEKALGGEDFSIFEPLALEYLAACVTGDHDIRILDMRLDHDLASLLRDYRPDLVGITSFTVHVNTVKGLFREIRAANPEALTVVGGHHATIMPEDFSTPAIDVIVAGEGAFVFGEIVRHKEQGMDLSGIPGALRIGNNGPIVIRREGETIDLDELPFPRRDLTGKYRRSYASEWMQPLASIRTSKGCPFRCRFCALWKLTGGRYLTRKPERIVEELKTIEERYVFFSDDESLLDAKRMETLADLIREEGIRKRYFLYGRSDTIAKHPGLMAKWKNVGLERVFVGLEFFRDSDLSLLRKGTNVKTNERAVRILRDLRLDIWPMFIVRPDFDRKDFAALLQYCRDLELDFIGFPVLTPLPGTDLYDDTKDTLVTTDYDYFDFFHTLLPTRLPLAEFYREMAALYERSTSLASRIRFMGKYSLRTLPSFFALTGNYSSFIERLRTLERDY